MTHCRPARSAPRSRPIVGRATLTMVLSRKATPLPRTVVSRTTWPRGSVTRNSAAGPGVAGSVVAGSGVAGSSVPGPAVAAAGSQGPGPQGPGAGITRPILFGLLARALLTGWSAPPGPRAPLPISNRFLG